MGPKSFNYFKTCVLAICKYSIVAEKSAREIESGQETEIFNKTLILSYNGDLPIVHCIAVNKEASQSYQASLALQTLETSQPPQLSQTSKMSLTPNK